MKLFIVALVSLAALVGASNAVETCDAALEGACDVAKNLPFNEDACRAVYGGYVNDGELQGYVGEHLKTSFQYLKLSAFFNSYQKDRPGFSKLFRSLSDRSFDDSVKLIKQITKRGGNLNIQDKVTELTQPKDRDGEWEMDEVKALGKVLQNEKVLAKKAMDIHLHFSGLHKTGENNEVHHSRYDPEITQFIEEEFLGKQADTVRKLSGYVSDLWKILADQSAAKALGTYLFDLYLQKQ